MLSNFVLLFSKPIFETSLCMRARDRVVDKTDMICCLEGMHRGAHCSRRHVHTSKYTYVHHDWYSQYHLITDDNK